MNEHLTELVFILDKSGSMSGLEADTIGGYNAMLEKQRKLEGTCLVTTVLFDHQVSLLHDRADIRGVRPLTEEDYQVGGATALLDAIGVAVSKIKAAEAHTAEAYKPGRVLFCILTDGAENSSVEFTLPQIKSMIEEQKRCDWEFIFLGANIDAVETAGRFGISADRAADYLADGQGTRLNFQMMNETVTRFREEGVLSDTCFDAIREDVKKRGKKR